MKTSLMLPVFLFLITIRSFVQPHPGIEKVYAYSREVLAGVAPSGVIHENGSIVERVVEPGRQYFIYAVTREPSSIVIKYIWLDGKRFHVLTRFRPSPVIIQHTTGKLVRQDTLVKRTLLKVINIEVQHQVQPGETSKDAVNAAHFREPVIAYLFKGKMHYLPVGNVQSLSPLVLQ